MKIGVDIDGVLIDFEERLRCRAAMYSYIELKKLSKDNDSYWVQDKYNWTEDELETFRKRYLLDLSKESSIRPGAEEILKLLKQQGNELIVISSRGMEIEEMITVVQEMIDKCNIKFDKYYWKTRNKLKICQDENIDIMIDDNPMICEKLSKNYIKTLYFRNADGKELEKGDYLKEVHNWGEIYAEIKELK